MTLHKKIAAVFALTISLLWAGSTQASLIGDNIDVTLEGGIQLSDLGITVTDDIELLGGDQSTTFGAFLFVGEFIDIGASSILIELDTALGSNGMLMFSSLDLGEDITSVVLTSSISAVEQEDVSFTATSVTLDLTDFFSVGGAAIISLDLLTGDVVNDVNAPTTIAIFGMVLLATGFVRRTVK